MEFKFADVRRECGSLTAIKFAIRVQRLFGEDRRISIEQTKRRFGPLL